MDDERALALESRERARHARDFQQDDGMHPMTDGWARYHPEQRRVPVRNYEGRMVELTPAQHTLMIAVRPMEGQKVSATIIANSIGVAVSTVTRGLLVLAALKLIAFDVQTGRSGGFTFLKMAWADLKARSRTAWDRLKRSKDRAEKRAHTRWQERLQTVGWFTYGLNFASSLYMDATFSEAT